MTRLRGLLWLTAGIVVALLAGVVGFNTLSRAAEAPAIEQQSGAKAQVVVAARSLAARSVLSAEDVVLKEMAADLIPAGAAKELADVLEMSNLSDFYAGEIVVLARLFKPNVIDNKQQIGVAMTDQQVLMGIPAQDFLSTLDVLKPGDHIDILFSLDVNEVRGNKGDQNAEKDDVQQSTFHTLQNVTIAGLPRADVGNSEVDEPSGPPAGLLVAIDPQDAMTLKYALDAGGTIDFVLRAPGVEQTFDTNPVDVDYLIERYGLPIGPE